MEAVRRAVRRARAGPLFLVFVVMDGVGGGGSVLDTRVCHSFFSFFLFSYNLFVPLFFSHINFFSHIVERIGTKKSDFCANFQHAIFFFIFFLNIILI